MDVVVEIEVSGRPIVMSIECRDHKRKATVEWIDMLIGKHERLPTNKLIAVSNRGFTKGAMKRGKAHDIDTLTMRAA